jgi:nucleotide-binding universal stress UspA family protein
MGYRTILVDIDPSDRTAERIGFAAGLANTQQAHLVGVTQTGIDHFLRESALPGIEWEAFAPLFDTLRERAGLRAAQFDEQARQAGVASVEHRIGDGSPGSALAILAMYADLVIVSQRDPAATHAAGDVAAPEYVAMHAACPVLVLPWAGSHAPVFERVLVAWNASPEAARAVRQALPLLRQAKQVDVAIVEENDGSHMEVPNAGPDIASFLERHGVAVHIRPQPAAGDVGETLLSLAADTAADLLVLGCYGHSRFNELLLGGVSRTILRSLTLPALIAH